ncbi:hypothetical protein [Legionella taurinensis]|uniref:hypothetical protein n=1 Tax=Legionella taurinensis TaxID=70611 RepID=UPI001055DF77|nr:hypothetical protein [Legionella taurinensis]MDX1837182.1 hypothetical protein [Legionella taurinensis]
MDKQIVHNLQKPQKNLINTERINKDKRKLTDKTGESLKIIHRLDKDKNPAGVTILANNFEKYSVILKLF